MKFGWKEYWKPTPKNIRKTADAVSLFCTAIGGYSTLNNNASLGTAIFVTGTLSKVVSNFFSENQTINNE